MYCTVYTTAQFSAPNCTELSQHRPRSPPLIKCHWFLALLLFIDKPLSLLHEMLSSEIKYKPAAVRQSVENQVALVSEQNLAATYTPLPCKSVTWHSSLVVIRGTGTTSACLLLNLARRVVTAPPDKALL